MSWRGRGRISDVNTIFMYETLKKLKLKSGIEKNKRQSSLSQNFVPN